jgi:hypothetical protein
MNATTTPHITELRQHLMDTLADLRNRDKPMEPDRARAVAQVASVLVDTARVEIDFLKVTGRDESDFLKVPEAQGLPNGIISITRHRLEG